jgi:uncharacterized membrane protein YedE/YeeE
MFFSLLAGLVFGLGLIISGMTDPGKVLGFLDLAGNWDPSLVCVMVGAIAVAAWPFARARRRSLSLLNLPMKLPQGTRIDTRLVLGNAVFGVGWGLAGICPGPAVVLAGAGLGPAMIFALAMLAGMALFELLQRRSNPR